MKILRSAVNRLKAVIDGSATNSACEEVGGIHSIPNAKWVPLCDQAKQKAANDKIAAAMTSAKAEKEFGLADAAKASRERLKSLSLTEAAFVSGDIDSKTFCVWYFETFGFSIDRHSWQTLLDRRAFNQFDEAPKIEQSLTGPSKKQVHSAIFIAMSIAATKGEVSGRNYTIEQMDKEAERITERLFK